MKSSVKRFYKTNLFWRVIVIAIFLERVYNLFKSIRRKAKLIIILLVFSFRSQLRQRRRYFPSQLKLRSITQRCGVT